MDENILAYFTIEIRGISAVTCFPLTLRISEVHDHKTIYLLSNMYIHFIKKSKIRPNEEIAAKYRYIFTGDINLT